MSKPSRSKSLSPSSFLAKKYWRYVQGFSKHQIAWIYGEAKRKHRAFREEAQKYRKKHKGKKRKKRYLVDYTDTLDKRPFWGSQNLVAKGVTVLRKFRKKQPIGTLAESIEAFYGEYERELKSLVTIRVEFYYVTRKEISKWRSGSLVIRGPRKFLPPPEPSETLYGTGFVPKKRAYEIQQLIEASAESFGHYARITSFVALFLYSRDGWTFKRDAKWWRGKKYGRAAPGQ